MAPTSFLLLSIFSCVQFISILALLSVILNYEVTTQNKEVEDKEDLYAPTKPFKQQGKKEHLQNKHAITKFSSSVFCTGKNNKERECRFLNLCFNTSNERYIFLTSDNSRVFGVPYERDKPALLDISSVNDHSAKYFDYQEIPSSNFNEYDKHKIQFIKGSSILFHRFNPENIMHVFHDDLIPLYHMRKKYFPSNSHVNIIMTDGRVEDEYFHLYKLFSDNIFTKSNFSKQYICFEDVVIGLSKTTTWYQYGFRIPQGPINVVNYPVSELKYFNEEFKSKLGIKSSNSMADTRKNLRSIVLFSRSQTRKILNQGKLLFKLTSHFKMPVQTIDLEIDSIPSIVSFVSKASIVIGVHGAHLITSLFMQPNTTLVEIFPFGIPAENYTPYKTLAELLGVNYIAWENRLEENTVTYEDWPSFVGGISELSFERQKEIKELKTVPVHLCCKDPVWLFRIYQDTIVDVKDFVNSIEAGIT